MLLRTFLVAALLLPAAHAQTTPTYDAVSIKPNKTASFGISIDSDGSHYNAVNITLKSLLENAFDVRQDLISGIPSALESQRFDIAAKVVDPDPKITDKLTNEQRRAMVLAILTDRFGLKAHIEIRTLPLYELTVFPSGVKVRKSPIQGGDNHGTSIQNRSLEATGITMVSFAASLTGQVHKTVIDKTGLPGEYDISLKWSRDDADPATETDPPLLTALQEQLGLKLRPAKGPVPTLVVDQIQMPSDN